MFCANSLTSLSHVFCCCCLDHICPTYGFSGYHKLCGPLLCVFHVMMDLGTDQLPSGKPLWKVNAPMDQTKVHRQMPQKSTWTIAIIIILIIIIIIILDHICGVFFSNISGVKIYHLAEKKSSCLDSPHCVFVCERVQIDSCDANPFAPGSSHGDSSYYGYCMISVSATVQECVCELYLRNNTYVLNGRPLETLQAGW